jgi:hypothetical protein
VLLQAVSIRHGRGISVETLPVGTLRAGEPMHAMVLATADREVSTNGLVAFSGVADRDGGGTGLGVTGICGHGWSRDGDPIEEDPCAGASPASRLPAGRPSTLHLALYAATPAGEVTSGTYRITIPLDDPNGPLLDLTYRVAEQGQAELPPWGAERIPLALGFENDAAGVWPTLSIRIEDGYGRVVDQRELSSYKDHNPDMENDGVFTVDVPRNVPLNIVLLRRDGGVWTPCSSGVDLVSTTSKWPHTQLLGDCLVR